MARARVTCTYVFEYEIEPDAYPPEITTDLQRLAVDITNFSDVTIATESIFLGADLVSESVSGELLKEEANV